MNNKKCLSILIFHKKRKKKSYNKKQSEETDDVIKIRLKKREQIRIERIIKRQRR